MMLLWLHIAAMRMYDVRLLIPLFYLRIIIHFLWFFRTQTRSKNEIHYHFFDSLHKKATQDQETLSLMKTLVNIIHSDLTLGISSTLSKKKIEPIFSSKVVMEVEVVNLHILSLWMNEIITSFSQLLYLDERMVYHLFTSSAIVIMDSKRISREYQFLIDTKINHLFMKCILKTTEDELSLRLANYWRVRLNISRSTPSRGWQNNELIQILMISRRKVYF